MENNSISKLPNQFLRTSENSSLWLIHYNVANFLHHFTLLNYIISIFSLYLFYIVWPHSTILAPCSRYGQDQPRGGHRRRAQKVCPGAQPQHQGRPEWTQQRERDCLQWDGEDVVSVAHHVAGIPVRLHLCPLRGVSMEEMYPLHQTEGLCPLYSVSKVQHWAVISVWTMKVHFIL